MANLPKGSNLNSQDVAPNVVFFALNPTATSQHPTDQRMESTNQYIQDLLDPNLRDDTILVLSKNREIFLDLAPLAWSSGCVAVLLQEISSIYHLLSPPNLTAGASFRICNTLVLLQCVASHPDTRAQFLNACIPLCLYPFLKTTSKTIPFEYLRVTTLGVISAFFEVDDTQEIAFLLATGIVPLLLPIMLMSGELSKRVATFIVQKIMFNSGGLGYICETAERFFEVCHVLENMVQYVAEKPSPVLLKHIIRCYLGLTKSSRACACLRNCLPETFRDPSFSNYLGDDTATKQCLHQLLYNLSDDAVRKVKVPTFLRHKL